MNFYEYLSLPSNATEQQIKKAFRNLAKQKHPDLNHKNEAFWEMVELNLIRDTLLNKARRDQYDFSLKNEVTTTYNQTNILSKIKSFFIYHCIICGEEMNSTWKGYCLYHYLEQTDQLQNIDKTFIYAGNKYRWQNPLTTEKTKTSNISLKNIEYYLTISIFTLIVLLLFILLIQIIKNISIPTFFNF